MRTLRDRLVQVEQALEGHQEDEARNLKLGHARRRVQRLERAVGTLEAALDGLGELRRAEVEMEAPSVEPTLIDEIEEQRARANTSDLAAGEGDEPPLVGSVDDYASRVRDEVLSAWNDLRHRVAPAPTIDEELLALASRDEPSLSEKYERLRSDLTILGSRTYPEDGDIERWIGTVDRLRDLSSQVADAAPSQPVVEFIRAANDRGGATLEQLSHPDVREYLAEENRSARFRVVAR